MAAHNIQENLRTTACLKGMTNSYFNLSTLRQLRLILRFEFEVCCLGSPWQLWKMHAGGLPVWRDYRSIFKCGVKGAWEIQWFFKSCLLREVSSDGVVKWLKINYSVRFLFSIVMWWCAFIYLRNCSVFKYVHKCSVYL